MSQSEILKEIEKSDWITVEELMERTGLSDSSVSSNLKRLMKQNLLLKKQEKIGRRIINKYKIKLYERG